MDIIKKQLVIGRTGEVCDLKDKHISDIFNEEGYKFFLKAQQLRVFSFVEFPKELTPAEGWAFFRIAQKMLIFEKNKLCCKYKMRPRPADYVDIASFLKIQERQAYRYMETFFRLGLMNTGYEGTAENKLKWIVVNPLYFMQGRRLSYFTYCLFIKQLNQVLPKYAIKTFEDYDNIFISKKVESEIIKSIVNNSE